MYDKFIKVGYVGQASGIPGTMAASGGAWCLEGAADPAGQSGQRKNSSNLCNVFLRTLTRQLVAVIWMRSRKIHKGSQGRMAAPPPCWNKLAHNTCIGFHIVKNIRIMYCYLEWLFSSPQKDKKSCHLPGRWHYTSSHCRRSSKHSVESIWSKSTWTLNHRL